MLKFIDSDLAFNPCSIYDCDMLEMGLAHNSINSTSFRKNALITHFCENGDTFQYAAFYDCNSMIILAQKKNDEDWFCLKTGLYGRTTDAHNSISIITDKLGYLHMAWSDHNRNLNYMRSQAPHSLIMRKYNMTGLYENKVTYPEFYQLPSGNLILLYRSGASGNGNLILNRYDISLEQWIQVHSNLISGNNTMSPYWQATIDNNGRLHISWVWRDTSDVSSNHDISYAVSEDSSMETFFKANGQQLNIPITQDQGALIYTIPPNSALINQTSMTTDNDNLPYIVSYWRVNNVVQYIILRYDGQHWTTFNTNLRTSNFELSSKGTKQLPCARPQLLVKGGKHFVWLYLLFRDIERSSCFSIRKIYY